MDCEVFYNESIQDAKMQEKGPVSFALIGIGYWGPNYVRILNDEYRAKLTMVCDKDPSRFGIRGIKKSDVVQTTDAKKVIGSNVEAVVISTPASTHFELCKQALNNGKNVLVEKPLALSAAQATELYQIARDDKLVLMGGMVYLYNNAVKYMRERIHGAKILHAFSLRTALGPIRSDVGAIWDLAIHDFSIMRYLFDETPSRVWCVGERLLGPVEDIAIAWLHFSNSVASSRVSWMDPVKRREFTIVTDRSMMILDDANISSPIQIYEKGVEVTKPISDFGQFKFQIKNGDVILPYIQYGEPLASQVSRFIDRIMTKERPMTWEDDICLDTIRISEAADKSLKSGGKTCLLEESAKAA